VEEQGVVTAPMATRLIEEGLARNRVVIDTVVRKYCDHILLCRARFWSETPEWN